MDSLRITLLVLGAVFVALIYAWERIKRGKDETRYARWGGIAEEGTEAHIVGRNSGDLETDSKLVDSAYDEPDDNVNDVDDLSDYDDEINDSSSYDDIESNIDDDWQSEVEASLAQDVVQESTFSQDDNVEPDLDSDPELNKNPIEDITSELEALEEIIAAEHEPDQIELGDFELPVEDADIISHEPDRIIAVHVLARDGAVFTGPDILSSLMHLGMQYGDMNVFHCFGSNHKSIFSLVNAMEPGVFDLSDMDNMSTPALLLMMALPNPLPALEAYDGMLAAARSLAASLDGRLCDDRRSVLTKQAIDEIRAELAGL